MTAAKKQKTTKPAPLSLTAHWKIRDASIVEAGEFRRMGAHVIVKLRRQESRYGQRSHPAIVASNDSKAARAFLYRVAAYFEENNPTPCPIYVSAGDAYLYVETDTANDSALCFEILAAAIRAEGVK